MTYATAAQRDLIRSLSGVSVEVAAQNFGFAPGRSLSVADASMMIDDLQAPAVQSAPSEFQDKKAARDAAYAEAQKLAAADEEASDWTIDGRDALQAHFNRLIAERGLAY